MTKIPATRTFLEMTDRSQLQAAAPPVDADRVRIERLDDCSPGFYRRLYVEVGREYHWVDRLGWTDEQIGDHLRAPGLTLWLMTVNEESAGYFELRRHADGSTEIAYFGLLPPFIGRGLGKWLLTAAAERAWETRPIRVWLHTSSLDHPSAFPNYVARGFQPYRTEQIEVEGGVPTEGLGEGSG